MVMSRVLLVLATIAAHAVRGTWVHSVVLGMHHLVVHRVLLLMLL